MTSIKGVGKARGHVQKYYQLYLMVLPAFIIILLFNYLPMYGIQLAFREFDFMKGLTGGDFVGFKYFSKFINSFQFVELLRNTFLISFYSLLFAFPAPILLALLFNQIRNEKIKSLVKTVSYMPHFISVIVLVGMISIFLSPSSGIAGHIFRALGQEPINLMGESKFFRTIYVVSEVWQHAGWNSIIYMAALAGISPELYEAAEMDGAGRLQKILHIDLPCLIPTIIILLILNSGSLMSVGFEKVFLMQNSLNMSVSEVISTYVYKIGIISNQISYSAAIGLFNTVINFVFLVAVNFISKRLGDISIW